MRRLSLLLIALALAGCDQLGIESAASTKARVEADGKAIGGACRHAGRAIEDCYTLNKKAEKAAIYAGWREMNEYMTENKLEPVAPVIPPEPPKPPKQVKPAAPPADAADAEADPEADSQPASKH
jgi:hypothetical protein